MSDGDFLAGLVSVAAVIITWPVWYADLFRVNRLAARGSHRLVLGLTPIACLLLILLCLDRWSSSAVRHNRLYILIYMFMGAATLGVSAQLFCVLGLSARDDALERRNVSAVIAVVGALLGVALCFAGGNIGEGPAIYVVLLSAAQLLVRGSFCGFWRSTSAGVPWPSGLRWSGTEEAPSGSPGCSS